MPLNDVMSPILAAYYEGKRQRQEREQFENQKLVQQQKLQQEQEQMKAQQERWKAELADRAQGRKDTLDYNKAQLDLLTKEKEFQHAQANSNVMREWLNTWTERTGRPIAGEFKMPMLSPRGTGAVPGMDTNVQIPADFAKIPGRPDLPAVDVRNIPDVPYSKQSLLEAQETRRIAEQHAHEDREARLKSEENWRKYETDMRNQRAREMEQFKLQISGNNEDYLTQAAHDVLSLKRDWQKDVPEKSKQKLASYLPFTPPKDLANKLDRFANVGPLLQSTRELIPQLGTNVAEVYWNKGKSMIKGTDIAATVGAELGKVGNLLRAPGIGSAEKGNAALKEVERTLGSIPNITLTQDQAKKLQGDLESNIVKAVEYELRSIPEGEYKELYRQRALEPLGLYQGTRESTIGPNAGGVRPTAATTTPGVKTVTLPDGRTVKIGTGAK